jgi:transcriptional regulator of met regulon
MTTTIGEWQDMSGDTDIIANPPHGERADFRKITVTMPQIAYEQLIRESARRKIAGERNQLLSALVREAIFDYLKRLSK